MELRTKGTVVEFEGYTPGHDFYLIEATALYTSTAFDLMCNQADKSNSPSKLAFQDFKIVGYGPLTTMYDIGDSVKLSGEVTSMYFDGSGNAPHLKIKTNESSFDNLKKAHLKKLEELGFIVGSRNIITGNAADRNNYITSLGDIMIKEYFLCREYYILCVIPSTELNALTIK